MPILLEKSIVEKNLLEEIEEIELLEEIEKNLLEEKAVRAEPGISTTQTPTRDAGLISRFLELPVPVVLLSLWVTGAALMGICALTLYHLLGLLLSASGGP
jgi:hypothetical protein